MARPRIRAKSDASESTSAPSASESGCRAIRGQMLVKIASNVTSASIHTNRYRYQHDSKIRCAPRKLIPIWISISTQIVCSVHWKSQKDSTYRINRRYIHSTCAKNVNCLAIIAEKLKTIPKRKPRANTQTPHKTPFFFFFFLTFLLRRNGHPTILQVPFLRYSSYTICATTKLGSNVKLEKQNENCETMQRYACDIATCQWVW